MKSALAGTQDFAGGVEDYKFDQAICCVQFAQDWCDDEQNVGRRDGVCRQSPLVPDAKITAHAFAVGSEIGALPAIILPCTKVHG